MLFNNLINFTANGNSLSVSNFKITIRESQSNSNSTIGRFWENKVHNLFILFQNGLGNVLLNALSEKFVYMPVL